MSQYAMAGSGGTGIAGGLATNLIQPITLGDVSKRFPTHKVTINIYGAVGGHIVEIGKSGYGEQNDLHIIPEGEDFDRALGKIITHYTLKHE